MQMKKVLMLVLILGLVLTFWYFFTHQKSASVNKQTTSVSQNDTPRVVSTNPDPLEDNIVSSNQIIEITFNRPLENVGEFKVRIDPKIDYKLELSPDRKTGRIVPQKPLELGVTYTLFIGTDTKFDGVGAWGQEKIFHFKTIRYTGV